MKDTNEEKKVPVMLLFFNRPDCLRQVFDAIKKYQPRQLFLVQDGARVNHPDDQKNVEECRKIVEEISWECEVYKNYSNTNMGCDYREFTGIDWCFQHVNELIILEDDCVPTMSFFNLCAECLELYKNNSTIHSISGFNRLGTYNNNTNEDYVFSMTCAGIGWATWKRTWNLVKANQNLDFLNDGTCIQNIKRSIDKNSKMVFGDIIRKMINVRENDIKNGHVTSWETLVGFVLLAYHMLAITPKKNLIKYIGISENATHSYSDPRLLLGRVSKTLLQPEHELNMPISHPRFVIRDLVFEKLSSKTMKSVPIIDNVEVCIRKMLFSRKKKK